MTTPMPDVMRAVIDRHRPGFDTAGRDALLTRSLRAGTIAPADPSPGSGQPRRYDAADAADLDLGWRIATLLGPYQGSVTPARREVAALVAAWRDAGRPSGWMITTGGQVAFYRGSLAADVVVGLLRRGLPVVVVPVGP